MDNNLIGTRLGKYEIQAEIGRGGMGAVYKGYDPMLDRYVAVKVLAPHLVWEQEFVERFLREARAAARLKHAHIVTIHDVGQEGGWYYFVMEYLEGLPLKDVVLERGPLPPDEVLSILRPLAGALDYAHHRGLVHRDIKPANVTVSPGGLVTLTDFGIARAAQETRLTRTGTIVGTPEYMSPEQAKGLAVGARSDQYSLAVVAYEMLSGRVPFEAESTLALLHKIAYEPPPPIEQARPDLPAGVGDVLGRALAKEPGDRYPAVGAFVDALALALAGERVEKPAERPAARLEVVPSPVQMETKVMEPEVMAAPAPEMPPQPEPDVMTAPVLEMPPQPEPEVITAPAPEIGPQIELEAAAVSVPEMPPLPEPEPVVSPMPGRGGTKVMREVQPAVPLLRRVPMWGWALGGLAVLALIVGLAIGVGPGEQPESTPAPASSQTGALEVRLVFVSDRDGKREVYHLTDEGQVKRVTQTPGRGESWSPVALPDGTLFFTSDRDGKREIYHLTKDGEVERVTQTPGDGESWSPAVMIGGTLFFTSDRDGKQEVYHITGEGQVERVTQTPSDGESWSPVPVVDGTIFFTSDRDGKREVYHITKEGQVERVTQTPGDGESWSPALVAGGTIFFTSDRGGKREVYHVTKEGTVEQVTQTPGDGESWSPIPMLDGTVFFTSDRDGKQEIYHLTKEGQVERVTHTPGDRESWSPSW